MPGRIAPVHAAGLVLALLALGASTPGTGRGGARPARLSVFAAASLSDAFGALGRAFEAAHPGVEVEFNFAGSQQLALQIEHGAGAEVFASADERWMNYLSKRGLLAG